MKFALFGAGKEGIAALSEIGSDRISCFIDNKKTGEIQGIPIKSINEVIREKDDLLIFITSSTYWREIALQLDNLKIENYFLYSKGRVNSSSNYSVRLSKQQWGSIYNKSMLEQVVKQVNSSNQPVQSIEMLNLTKKNQKVLEIGCGSGETSLFLAKHNRHMTAIDFSEQSILLVNKAVEITGYKVKTYNIDAVNKLPFKNREFDVAFQAGLLEHFDRCQRIRLLDMWRPICKIMVSLIPNAHCLAYRAGKAIAEANGTWQWGLEMPQSTLKSEFEAAGYTEIQEYTIGERQALNFLPPDHYLRIALNTWFQENKMQDDIYGQGYLLVTVGHNPEGDNL